MTSLALQYQKKTDKQHILDNPDTYIGSIENVDSNMWIYDEERGRIHLKQINYIPGLYKLFDEGIVNCRDHVIRMINQSNDTTKCVTYIETTITDDGTITFENDGNGIDIEKHPEYGIWIPEMVFGHLRTSTNYNKEEKKIVGGKNGFGFKLVLIWSTYGRIETVDHVRGLKYVQEFHNNLDTISEPIITKVKSQKPYTKVSFKPDYARLGISGLSVDMISLLKKRTYDIGAITDHKTKKIKIKYNNEILQINNFQQYVDLYIGKKDESKRVYEESSERWEYAVSLSNTHQFEQISFVNGICTMKGGKHVDYIINQITRKLQIYIEKKKKVIVNINTIKEQLIIFVRSDIENPSFDSQTKDYMNTPASKFGSLCTVSDNFIEKIAKMGVMDVACALTDIKENRIAKKTDGSKTKTVRGIANFSDANDAGTIKSKDCVLILCEGLSAMSGVVSGLSSGDRNRYGIYPLKGKLLNVRGELTKRISENKEITDLKKILGLESGKEYKSMDDVHRLLRYGKIMILTDSDVDGSHIKGLCVNLFQSEYTSLFKISGFLSFMNTPILRAIRGKNKMLFYNEGEYLSWKNSLEDTSGWTIKYFKGLGTSTGVEFKEYFENNRVVDFIYTDESTDDMIDKIFNKKRPDDRKKWLQSYEKTSYLNTSVPIVKYEDFIDKELIHFSMYDCQRSLPNLIDGLKTSQRKILFCAFKRNLTKEIKVAQFSGYISENACYHHGEASLHSTTISMCQDFVGSNNINLLQPLGQFGTRSHGGSDSASERYIFTNLSPITRFIFPERDETILNYLCDDGVSVEPNYYIPIIPFVLCNGQLGIGTGYSTTMPSFDPKQIIEYIRNKLTNTVNEPVIFLPYYEQFKGTVSSIINEPHKFMIKGTYIKIDDDTIRINELPISTWTMPYLTFIESLLDGIVDKNGKKKSPIIKDFKSNSTEKIVDICITFPYNKLKEYESEVDTNGINGLEKILKLTTSVSTTNMHLFDKDCKLVKYDKIIDIIDAFFEVRLEAYDKRKKYLISYLEKTLIKLSMKAKFVQYVLDDTIDLRKKTMNEIEILLGEYNLVKLDDSFDYLIKMPMNSVSKENVYKLLNEKANNENELEQIKNTTIHQMWLKELIEFDNEYTKYKSNRNKENSIMNAVSTVKVNKNKK
jgi:DNA topoisomerase-2